MENEDKADDSLKDLPGNDQPLPASDKTIAEPDNIIPPQTQNMEVHHHPQIHHKKKHFKEYFLEFIMIFLAVTMGFIAESLRENIADHGKEKAFIRSMIEDAVTDTVNIHAAIAINMRRIGKLDTLATLCFMYGDKSIKAAQIYNAFFPCLRHPDFVNPTERTLMQLKNSGGMRLIEKKVAADSIIQYDDFIKKLADQQVWYENMLTALVETSMHVINYKYNVVDPTTLKNVPAPMDSSTLVTADNLKIIELGNRASIYKAVVRFYIIRLKEGNQHAINLINTLQKEYAELK